MAKRQYSGLQTFLQTIASTRPGAWYFARTQHHIDRILLRLTNNTTSLTSLLAGLPVFVLTSKGAKSGLLRTVPLIGIRDEFESGKVALVASNYGQKHYPGWYYNLKANPQARGSIEGQNREYIAHEAAGEEYDRFWQAALDTYMGFSEYQKRIGDQRHIPIMVLAPTGQMDDSNGS